MESKLPGENIFDNLMQLLSDPVYLHIAHYSCLCVSPTIVTDRSIEAIAVSGIYVPRAIAISSYKLNWAGFSIAGQYFLLRSWTLAASIWSWTVTLPCPSL